MSHDRTRTAVTIGKFDALHLGHRALVERASALGDPLLVSFTGMADLLGWPQRLPLVAPSQRDGVLASWSAQVGRTVATRNLPFAEIRPMSPERFVAYLAQELGAGAVVVGEDFRFGHNRSGDADALKRLAATEHMEVALVPHVQAGGSAISSSRVRCALATGDVVQARTCLGRPHRVVGTVVRGDGRGRQLGVPTANCGNRENQEPSTGVYAAWAHLEPGGTFPAAVNVGVAPSVGEHRPLTVEAHLIGFVGECYDVRLGLDFIARLREERRFATLGALREQLQQDIVSALAALRAHSA